MSPLRSLSNAINAPLARVWYGLRPGNRILMYHRVDNLKSQDQLTVSPDLFEQQIHWLSKHHRIVSLKELSASLQHGNASSSAIALTFDDGYLDNLEHALPVLEKYQAPATLYVTTQFAAQKERHPRYPTEKKRLHLTWAELRELSAHALIEIGSHTLSHPMLSSLSAADSHSEITQSKSIIENELGHAINSFCYPAGNHTTREIESARSAGYQTAVTVKPGVNRRNTNPLALKRLEITFRDEPGNLKLKLDGAYDLVHQALDIKREHQFRQLRKDTLSP